MVTKAGETPNVKPGLNLVSILKDYIDNMLSETQGRKALILDKETLSKAPNHSRNVSDAYIHLFSDRVDGLLENANPAKGSLLL